MHATCPGLDERSTIKKYKPRLGLDYRKFNTRDQVSCLDFRLLILIKPESWV